MINQREIQLEQLNNLTIYKLRIILTELNGVPSFKTADEIRKEILLFYKAKKSNLQENTSLEIADDNGNIVELEMSGKGDIIFDIEIPEEPKSDVKCVRGMGSLFSNLFNYSNCDVGGLYDPTVYEFRDSGSEARFEETRLMAGVLDCRDNYGFLKPIFYGDRKGDTYVEKGIIAHYNLKKGDYIVGYAHNKQENVAYSLCDVMQINGVPIETFVRSRDFDERRVVYPKKSLISPFEKDKTVRAIDMISPIGKGQRGLIVAPPKAGKTTLLKKLAKSIIESNEEVMIMLLLIDERPEEVSDFEQSIPGAEIIASTFDEGPERHVKIAELAVSRAKRLVEMGRDVVILLDSITKLARAYNVILPSNGKVLSGGIDPQSLTYAKKIFGAARNFSEFGSLTIIATALVETGSKLDEVVFEEFKGTGNMEIVLSKELAERRIFPAIDMYKSGTRKDDLIVSEDKLDAMMKVRSRLAVKGNSNEIFLEMIKQSKDNEDFIKKVDYWLKAIFD